MGSGHFLVNATNHIANFIVEILNEYPGYNSEIDSNPGLWRRRVVEGCIYGVDLNPLAVELAKLCLWITTAFKEKPLSFLNHHLKQGNALVGVRISDLEEYLTKARGLKHDLFMQSYINSIKQAAESYKKKLSKLTEAREDIEKKKEILSELDEELAPYKYLCNLFTHYLLGKMNESDFLSQVESWSESKKSQKVLASLNSKDFFHWDLEFPDVFYGDNSGFDCVIGNPPYVEYSKVKTQYQLIECETKGCNNLYAFVVERSLNLIKQRGRFSMIVPIWGNSNPEYLALREIILKNSRDIWLSHFAVRPSKIFHNVDMNLTIMTILKELNNQEAKVLRTTNYIRWYNNERKNLFDMIKYVEIDVKNIINDLDYMLFPKIGSPLEVSILKKLLTIKNRINKYLAKDQDEKIDIFVHSGGRYWRKAFDEYYIREINLKLNSNWKKISLKKKYAYSIACLFNSSFFYWFWIVFSDCYNVRRNFLDLVPINFNDKRLRNFDELYWELVNDYKRNVVINENYKYENKYIFDVSKSKPIIDQIDVEFAKHYGFEQEEIDFIINYDIRFRCKGEGES